LSFAGVINVSIDCTTKTLEGTMEADISNVCEGSFGREYLDFIVAEDGKYSIVLRLFPNLRCIP